MVQWFSEAFPFHMFHMLALALLLRLFLSKIGVHVHPSMDDLSYGSPSSAVPSTRSGLTAT